MQAWLQNAHWTVYVHPRHEGGQRVWSWSLYGTARDDPFIEAASFGLEVRGFLRRARVLPTFSRLIEQHAEEAHQGYARWMANTLGLQTHLEMALDGEQPLLRWRLRWDLSGPPVRVARVVLLRVGPVMFRARRRGLRLGPGYIPLDFLSRVHPPEAEPGVLRLHPSPAPLAMIAPPWPWQSGPVRYSSTNPYRPPRGMQPGAVVYPPRPRSPEHAVALRWAVLWDHVHHRGLAIASASSQPPVLIEALLHPLHPALQVWYWPSSARWPTGHQEITPWVGLVWFSPSQQAALEAFGHRMQLEEDPNWHRALRLLVPSQTDHPGLGPGEEG